MLSDQEARKLFRHILYARWGGSILRHKPSIHKPMGDVYSLLNLVFYLASEPNFSIGYRTKFAFELKITPTISADKKLGCERGPQQAQLCEASLVTSCSDGLQHVVWGSPFLSQYVIFQIIWRNIPPFHCECASYGDCVCRNKWAVVLTDLT